MLAKIITSFCIASLVITSSQLSSAQADKKPLKLEEKEPKINFYLEMIEIDAIEFADLMTAKFDQGDHTALRNKLLEKVKAGKAKLLENQSMHVSPSIRIVTESIKEYIYATEYDPAEFVEIPVKDPKVKPENKELNLKKEGVILPPNPTAFETRNLGLSWVVKAELGEKHQIISAKIEVELVKHIGDNVLGEWRTKAAKIVKIKMPDFYTLSLNSELMFQDGKFLLASTHTPEINGKADSSRKVLMFIKADVLKK